MKDLPLGVWLKMLWLKAPAMLWLKAPALSTWGMRAYRTLKGAAMERKDTPAFPPGSPSLSQGPSSFSNRLWPCEGGSGDRLGWRSHP